MLKKILIACCVAAGALTVAIATRPDSFEIERSIVVATPAEQPFAQVNDFRAWSAWSPFERLDPHMQRTYSGSKAGAGAVYSWAGNSKAGAGRMTIVESSPASRIAIKLEFSKPFESTNQATFTFTPAAEGTKVSWAMKGKNTLFGKAMSLVVNMDEMIGADFERGLATLKTLSERNHASTIETAKVH
jgi:hypothetical protein